MTAANEDPRNNGLQDKGPPKYSRAVRSTRENKTGLWRAYTPFLQPKRSPCEDSCPAGSPVPAWLAAVKMEQWARAWRIMQGTNPFPAITGQVCYRYCQENCYRKQLDETVGIPEIEVEIGNWRHRYYSPPPRENSALKVAVVGSGPAGLSCAYYLRQQGIQVAIYERAPLPGGLPALAIPAYRLPRAILDRELDSLREDGVLFKLNCSLDREAVGELLLEYRAVFIATGASATLGPDIPGLDLDGVWTALNFLEETNLGKKVNLSDPVVVLGGGSTALDAARMALRQEGIKEVTVVYRRKRAEMKAHPTEIAAAEAEGVRFIFDTSPAAVCGPGKVEQVVCNKMENPDITPPVAFPCGTLILATGQQQEETLSGIWDQGKPLFAGGDLLTGPSSVPAAIAGGREGAEKIIAFLQGKPNPPSLPHKKAIAFADLHLKTWPGQSFPVPPAGPAGEAGRCLGCGNCMSCGICALFCPDVAVSWDGEQYAINLDYCKGCGICTQECPSGVLEMRGVDGDR